MSYLETPDLPAFSKAIISFWFKVSQEALAAAQAESDQDLGDADPPPLWGLVPLLVFGKEGTGSSKVESENSNSPHTETHTFHSCATVNPTFSGGYPEACVSWENDCHDGSYETTWSDFTVSYSATPGKPTNPSYVAIDGSGYLQINFESTKMGEVSGFCGVTSGSGDHVTGGHADLCFYYPITSGCGSGTQCISDPLFPVGGLCGILIFVLGLIGLHLLTAVADQFTGSGSGNEHVEGKSEYGPVPVDFGTGAIHVSLPNGEGAQGLAGDAWHHVLISVDMSEGAAASSGGITASCTMYVAIDDKDYKTGSYPLEGTNKVVPGGAAAVIGMEGNEHCGPGSYSLKDMTVPSAPVGIPSVGKYVDEIHAVDMAELLIFTDKVLDTSKEADRRHFITAPDKNNFQRPPNTGPLFIPFDKKAIGDPAIWEPGADNPAYAPPLFDPSAWPTSIKGLGTADIDLTKCSWNWQMGRNIGTLEGKITRTGKVGDSFPDPKIAAGS